MSKSDKKIGRGIIINKTENNVVYAEGTLSYDIVTEVIPDAINYLKDFKNNENKNFDKLILKNLQGVDLEVYPDSTVKECADTWFTLSQQRSEEYRKKRKEWEESPEGIAQLKAEKEEAEREAAYRYNSADEAIAAVKSIEQNVDFKNGTTPIKEAVEFCKKAMIIFSKCDCLPFSEKQAHEFSEALKEKGACKYFDASDKYIDIENKNNFNLIINGKNNIEFPLHAFSQVIDTSIDIFRCGLGKITVGGEKSSWPIQWVNSQTPKNKNIEL